MEPLVTKNGMQIKLVKAYEMDEPDAHRVELWMKTGQIFRIGPDYWDTRENAYHYARLFRDALDSAAGPA